MIINTGYSLVQVTRPTTGSRFPYGKQEVVENENVEKMGAISAVIGQTTYAWNLASFDCDRYDRGCLISLHHAIQQAHYLTPKPKSISLTTDFKQAPKAEVDCGEWIEQVKLDEEVEDAREALKEILRNSSISTTVRRIGQAENQKAREAAAQQNRSCSQKRFYSINFDVSFFTDVRLYDSHLDEDTHQDAHISIGQMLART